MKITMNPISERQRARFYIIEKNCGIFIYICKNPDTLFCVTILFTKSHTVHITQFFMKFSIYIKKHHTLRYVMFYIQKAKHFEKSKKFELRLFIY